MLTSKISKHYSATMYDGNLVAWKMPLILFCCVWVLGTVTVNQQCIKNCIEKKRHVVSDGSMLSFHL
jgi:hypothetical protein